MRLANGGWRRQGALPVVMVGACAVLAACALAGGEPTQPDDTAAQTIDPTETTQTTAAPTGTTQTTDDTTTTVDAPTTTQTTIEPPTVDAPETEVTLPPPGVEPSRDYRTMREHITGKGTFPMMVAAPGGFVVGDAASANAVEQQDAKEMLELGALAMAYEFWRLVDEPGTPCPAHRLRVSWEEPDDVFGPNPDSHSGVHSPPLGPPRAGEDRAAGIVYCKGSRIHYYMGFDALWKPEFKAWAMYRIPTG